MAKNVNILIDWVQDELVTYYENGNLKIDQTLEEIRALSNM